MDEQARLAALVELAESLAIEVRQSPAASQRPESAGGSLVRLKGRHILFLDGSASLGDQIGAVASALRGRKELEDRFIAPELRQAIDGGQP